MKQVWMYLGKNKKGTLAMLLLLIVVTASVGGSMMLVNNAAYVLQQAAAEVYGEFHGIAFDTTEQAGAMAQRSALVTACAYIYNYGFADTEGASLRLGAFDEQAWEMANIQVMEGTLPQTDREIALEDRWRSTLDLALGDTITLQTTQGERAYTICGWLDNYRVRWARSGGVGGEVVEKHMPTGLVAEGTLPTKEISAMVCLWRLSRTHSTENSFNLLIHSMQIVSGRSQDAREYDEYYNDAAFGTNGGYGRFSGVQAALVLMLLAGASVSVYGLQLRQIRRLREQGADRKTVLLWQMTVGMAAMLMGLALTTVLNSLSLHLLGQRIRVTDGIWAAVVVLLSSCGMAALEYNRQRQAQLWAVWLPVNPPVDRQELLKRRKKRSHKVRIWLYIAVAMILGICSAIIDTGIHLTAADLPVADALYLEIPQFDYRTDHWGLGEEITALFQLCRNAGTVISVGLLLLGAYLLHMEFVRLDAADLYRLCLPGQIKNILLKEILGCWLGMVLSALVFGRCLAFFDMFLVEQYIAAVLEAAPAIGIFAAVALAAALLLMRRSMGLINKRGQ